MHTLAPWKVVSVNGGYSIRTCTGTRGHCVAQINWMIRGDDYDEAHANARLIAAAPELLEACKAAVDYVNRREELEQAAFRATDGNVTALDALVGQLLDSIAHAEGK